VLFAVILLGEKIIGRIMLAMLTIVTEIIASHKERISSQSRRPLWVEPRGLTAAPGRAVIGASRVISRRQSQGPVATRAGHGGPETNLAKSRWT
jgi:hypothetical protein